jgi:hypothetical protein
VFGKSHDVSAGAWFHVNANDDERCVWDKTCTKLKEIDQDPKTNTRVLYWRVKYPVTKLTIGQWPLLDSSLTKNEVFIVIVDGPYNLGLITPRHQLSTLSQTGGFLMSSRIF